MKANAFLIAIALALLLVCSFCVGFMHTTSHELMQIAADAAAALPDDPAAAQQYLEIFQEQWRVTEPRWQFIAIHDDLELVSTTLTEALTALAIADIDTAKIACEHLPAAIESIMMKELPTLGNIF